MAKTTYKKKKRTITPKCPFTKEGVKDIDYKDVETLEKYIESGGKIISSTISGTRTKFQRKLARAIKRARFLALIAYTDKHKN